MSKLPNSIIAKVAQERLREADAPLGYLTDHHLKWIKGYVYYKFGLKMVSFFIDFHSNPRRLFVVPRMDDGKIIPILQWVKMMWTLHKARDPLTPLLHPDFWPKGLDLVEWKVIFSRKPVKGKADHE